MTSSFYGRHGHHGRGGFRRGGGGYPYPYPYPYPVPYYDEGWMVDPSLIPVAIPVMVGTSGQPIASQSVTPIPGADVFQSIPQPATMMPMQAPRGPYQGQGFGAPTSFGRAHGEHRPGVDDIPGLTDERIVWDEGPPWPSKTWHAPGWYNRSDKGKVGLLRKMAKENGRDPRLREFVINQVLRPAGVVAESRQYQQQAQAILGWVQQNIAYLNEPGELIQSPWHTLKVKYGDCDDMAVLMAAMAETIALPWRLTLAGKSKLTGRGVRWREGEFFPRGVNFFHIYVTFGWPPFRPTKWMSAEPTMRVPLGHDVVDHGIPRGLPGLSGWGEALASAFGVAGEVPLSAKMPGKMIVTGATPIFDRAREIVVQSGPGTLSSWIGKVAVALAIAIPVQVATIKILKSRKVKRAFGL